MAVARAGLNPARRLRARWAAVVVASALVSPLTGSAASRYEIARDETINRGLGAPPTEVSRSSPAGAWHSFLTLAAAGKLDRAAHLLDLSETPPGLQPKVGADLSEKLYRVLQLFKVRVDTVTTEEEAGPSIGGQPTNAVVAVRFERSGIAGEVRLRHTVGASPYELAWLFSRETVASVPFWYRVLVKGEAARGAEPLDVGLGVIPPEVSRSTPREAVAGFLAACEEGRFDLASFYLDLGNVPPDRQRSEGARLARRLMLTLQRTGWPDPGRISNDPLGTPETGVPENEELFGVIQVRRQPVELLLAHRLDVELGHVWTVSAGTVAQIDRLYESHGYGWIGDRAPLVLFAVGFAGLQLWQWLALVVGLSVAWVVSRYLGRWAVEVLHRVARRTTVGSADTVARAFDGPLGFLLWAGILVLVARWLGLAPEAWVITRQICKLFALVGLGWFLLRLVDLWAHRIRLTAGADESVKLGFLPMAARLAKGVAVVLVALAALDVIGFNVLALLAGLGLGGVALAFAAQKTLENVFGTVSIAGDRPFEVGDYVTIGTDSGTVEDVGFRSTRLRTLARTLVTIPNGVVAAGRVENFTARDRILYKPVLRLAYATTTAQLKSVIDGVGQLLRTHAKVFKEEQRVRFAAFGESALQVEVWCWVATRDFTEYTEVVEELNFGIAEIVERSGTSFAFPTRALVMARDGVIDLESELRREAEARRGPGDAASDSAPPVGSDNRPPDPPDQR
jgi:MscS family membrane protein